MVGEEGTVVSPYGKVLKPRTNEFGYTLVTIIVAGASKVKRVHRLVGETYLPNTHSKPEINHIDCDKTNNHKSNLEWTTSKENKKHAWDNKLYTSRGEDHCRSKVNDNQVHDLCRRFEAGQSNASIHQSTGISLSIITQVRSGLNWVHISKHYSFNKRELAMRAEGDIIAVAELLIEGSSDKEVAETLGIDTRYVNNIRNKGSHKDLLSRYEFPDVKVSRMSEEQIRSACTMLSDKIKNKVICEVLGLRRDQVQKLKNRITHTKISSEYVW